jgi:hypothetical protein
VCSWRRTTSPTCPPTSSSRHGETQTNDFPRLPVREGERVAVAIATGVDEQAVLEAPELTPFRTEAAPVVARLEPTAGSAWRG